MVALLRSMPKQVIEAIVDNTIGHKYATDPEFAALFSERDSCAGIYLNTFVVKSTKKGLTANQWKDLHAMISR